MEYVQLVSENQSRFKLGCSKAAASPQGAIIHIAPRFDGRGGTEPKESLFSSYVKLYVTCTYVDRQYDASK